MELEELQKKYSELENKYRDSIRVNHLTLYINFRMSIVSDRAFEPIV